jgi:cytochrome b subunit of formate dehydrogenase
MLLENGSNNVSYLAGVCHELCVIVSSNTKDEAWSQHKHLYRYEDLKQAKIDLSSDRI